MSCSLASNSDHIFFLTLACRLPVGPLLNLDVVPGASDDVLVLEGGVGRNVEGVPGVGQGDLGAVLGLLIDLKQHLALVQVDVLKKPGENQEGIIQSLFIPDSTIDLISGVTFFKSLGFISLVHLVKSPKNRFGKGGQSDFFCTGARR